MTILMISSFTIGIPLFGILAIMFMVIAGYLFWRYLRYLDVVKATVKRYGLGLLSGRLAEVFKDHVLPKEVRITTYNLNEEQHSFKDT